MSPLLSGAPPPKVPQEYDPEIQDMASYIHNYKIDSPVAVCICILTVITETNISSSSTLQDGSSLTPSAAVYGPSNSQNAQSFSVQS